MKKYKFLKYKYKQKRAINNSMNSLTLVASYCSWYCLNSFMHVCNLSISTLAFWSHSFPTEDMYKWQLVVIWFVILAKKVVIRSGVL